MNIEDVKQLSDKKLNIAIAKSLGYKVVKVGGEPKYSRILSPDDQLLGKTHVVEQLAWESAIPKYSSDISFAREAQAKAIVVNAEGYIRNLVICIMGIGLRRRWTLPILTVSELLQATPRQIAEAAYITLMEVQHES